MKTWFALVAALAVSPAAQAQFPVLPPAGGPPPAFAPIGPLPPIPPARPMFRGPPGEYLYDSGNYLLGGFDGLSRSAGSFTMSGGTGWTDPGAAYASGPVTTGSCRRHARGCHP